MAQTRYHVFRFTSPDGVRATLCTTDDGEARATRNQLSGWTVDLSPWNDARGHGGEAHAPDGQLARVNLDHVLSVESWSVLR